MFRIKLVGATGYGGVGLIELLLKHPEFKIVSLVAANDTGRPLSDFWPHLKGFCDEMVYREDAKEAQVEADAVVFSTPDTIGQQQAPAAVSAGMKVLDYSGDFRFNTPDLYSDYARRIGLSTVHQASQLLPVSTYGLPELHRKAIANSKVVGNPGCFAVSCTLGWAPAIQGRLVEAHPLICDCKTGISGAGKKPKPAFHYPEAYDSMGSYRLSGHQHVMEVERELSELAGEKMTITFTPQVVPVCRGIMSCLYGRLASGQSQKTVLAAYRDFYANEPFVRIFDSQESCRTQDVRGSNYVNLQVACDERSGVFRVISHIDNLMKGQASNAVQNLNVMFGIKEITGLNFPGNHP